MVRHKIIKVYSSCCRRQKGKPASCGASQPAEQRVLGSELCGREPALPAFSTDAPVEKCVCAVSCFSDCNSFWDVLGWDHYRKFCSRELLAFFVVVRSSSAAWSSSSVLDLGGSGLHLAAETSLQTHLPGGPARPVKGLPPSLRIAAVSAGSDHTLGLPPTPHLMRAAWLAFGSGLGSGSSPNPDSTPNPDSDLWPGECRLRPLRVYRQRGPCVELGSPGAHAA